MGVVLRSFKRITEVRLLFRLPLHAQQSIEARFFNIDFSFKRTQLRWKVDFFAFEHNLNQIISKPTRITETSSTTIDLIFVNNSHRMVQGDVLTLNISDHCPVFCVIKGGVEKLPPRNLNIVHLKRIKHEFFSYIT